MNPGERRRAAAIAAALVVAAALTACADDVTGSGPLPSIGASAGTPSVSTTPSVTSSTWSPVARGDWTIRRCGKEAAPATTTNLRPRTVATSTTEYDVELKPGTFRVVRGPVLRVSPSGVVGDSPPGLVYGPHDATPVALDASTLAVPTSVGLLATKNGDELGFVELRVRPSRPVRWQLDSRLSIGTDGGDAGFAAAGALAHFVAGDQAREDQFLDDYIDASIEKRTSAPVDCTWIDQRGVGPVALFFSTGGDGGWPTLVGRDADGRIASIVLDGLSLPWSLSGLPGTPPKEVVDATDARRHGKQSTW